MATMDLTILYLRDPNDDARLSLLSAAEQQAIRTSRSGDLAAVDPYDYTCDHVLRVFEGVLDSKDLQCIRHHEITGATLLRHASFAQLKEDYGIFRMGSRTKILLVSEQLRRDSKHCWELSYARGGIQEEEYSPTTTPQTTFPRAATPPAYRATATPETAAACPRAKASTPVRRFSPFPPLRLWARDYPLVITNPIRRDDGRPFWADSTGTIFEPEVWKCDDGIARRGSVEISEDEAVGLATVASQTPPSESTTVISDREMTAAAERQQHRTPTATYRFCTLSPPPSPDGLSHDLVDGDDGDWSPSTLDHEPSPEIHLGDSIDATDGEWSPRIFSEPRSPRTASEAPTTPFSGCKEVDTESFTLWAKRFAPGSQDTDYQD
ncbi:hypothetical protein BZA05DRAFT_407824 [Tricharina praecox]|uniref:uncharacterized protein n=1 Tax=Tricharina praecox TaxID=43433 RepID=UPI00221F35C0|nr:uncharacterized protein BZA05DRAFT_407824 [Tricharina praecox]KAI5845494.1 hypothetical protein BZA05DRAFT_407824 [Tricharina praecox]